MRTNTSECMKRGCGQCAKYKLATSPTRLAKGAAIEACGRHLVWAVEFLGVPGGRPVPVQILT